MEKQQGKPMKRRTASLGFFFFKPTNFQKTDQKRDREDINFQS